MASAAFATTAHRPSQAPPYLFGLPSSGSVALDYGAFIMPGVGGRLGSLDLIGLTAGESDILALLGVPDFSRQRPAQAAQRPGRAGLSELRDVLGQQATLSGGLPLGQLPLLALGLVLFSSLLLIGAVLPPRVVARSPLTAASYARARQPLVIVAIGILIPVGLAALAIALSAPS